MTTKTWRRRRRRERRIQKIGMGGPHLTLSSRLGCLESVVSSPAASGAEPQPQTILEAFRTQFYQSINQSINTHLYSAMRRERIRGVHGFIHFGRIRHWNANKSATYPFQMMVLHLPTTSENDLMLCGPISRPCSSHAHTHTHAHSLGDANHCFNISTILCKQSHKPVTHMQCVAYRLTKQPLPKNQWLKVNSANVYRSQFLPRDIGWTSSKLFT